MVYIAEGGLRLGVHFVPIAIYRYQLKGITANLINTLPSSFSIKRPTMALRKKINFRNIGSINHKNTP